MNNGSGARQASCVGRGVGLPMAAAQQHRQLDALQRRTILDGSSHREAFVSQQLWYEAAVGPTGTVWWDLDLLYQTERRFCNRRQKKCHWMTEFKRRAAVDIETGDGDLPFQIRQTHGSVPS